MNRLFRLFLVLAILTPALPAAAVDWSPCVRAGQVAQSGVMHTLRNIFSGTRNSAKLSEGTACYAFTNTDDPDTEVVTIEGRAATLELYPDVDATVTGTATVTVERALYKESADAGEFEVVATLDGVQSTGTFSVRLSRGFWRILVTACTSCNGVLKLTADD